MSVGSSREFSVLRFGRRLGFTLIELLTVIVIIAVLAAIIFPVYSRARVAAYKSSDISNMNSLRNALQLYYADQGGYPPALLGYVNPYEDGPVDPTNVVPADALRTAIYPKRIELGSLKPVTYRAGLTETTNAVWPFQDSRPVGSAPVLDLNGDGKVDTNDDSEVEARQAYGPSDGFVKVNRSEVTTDVNEAANFYKVDGYEVATVQMTPTTSRTELRYTLFWTTYGLIQNGDSKDDPRQLGYAEPPETTIITWNSQFRDYKDGQPERGKNDIVLLVGGNARYIDSLDLNDRSWRTTTP